VTSHHATSQSTHRREPSRTGRQVVAHSNTSDLTTATAPARPGIRSNDATEKLRLVKANEKLRKEFSIEEFLSSLNMLQYLNLLVDEGYDRWDALALAGEEDLEDIGIKRGHRKVILNEISTTKEGICSRSPLLFVC
jgi:hypothetical protein